MIASARQTAFEILYHIEKNCEYSNIGLDKALSAFSGNQRDRAFITNLVNGVCERRITLDYAVRQNLNAPKTRLKPNVRTILRMGVYEILFCDGIPARASVNEYVNLTKGVGAVYASSLVNAVLRKIAAAELVLPDPDAENYLSIKYSFPLETVQYFREIFGGETEAFLSSSLERPKIYGRINSLRTDFSALKQALLRDHIEIEAVETVPNAFYFKNSAAFMDTEAFRNGLFHIQDLSSQLCCLALKPQKGDQIIDVCASPGGKAFTLAQMAGSGGTVTACDIYKHKIGLIRQGADRLGLSGVKPQLRDAATAESQPQYDRVLCDVPCSGFGVIRKKSEIKYKSLNELKDLPALQYAILENSSALLHKNGRLVYSTCTVTREENEEIVQRFLREHKNFRLDTSLCLPICRQTDCGYRLSPITDDCDGFFFAPLIREDG